MNESSIEKRPVQKEKVVFQPPFLGALLLSGVYPRLTEIGWNFFHDSGQNVG